MNVDGAEPNVDIDAEPQEDWTHRDLEHVVRRRRKAAGHERSEQPERANQQVPNRPSDSHVPAIRDSRAKIGRRLTRISLRNCARSLEWDRRPVRTWDATAPDRAVLGESEG